MNTQLLVFALVSCFHDLFSAIWMGGLIVTVLAYLPAVKDALGAGPQVKKVMQAFQKRQSLWVYISMAGLILTGLLLSRRSPEFVGLFRFGDPYSAALSIKHILVLAMLGIALYRSLALGRPQAGAAPTGRAAPAGRAAPEKKERLSMQLLLVNAVLAVAVLLASGFSAALAGG